MALSADCCASRKDGSVSNTPTTANIARLHLFSDPVDLHHDGSPLDVTAGAERASVGSCRSALPG